jgi:hypothetical protein
LIEAYPEAKIIITTRDVDSWHNSVMKTVNWRATDPELKAVAVSFHSLVPKSEGEQMVL